MVGQAFHPVGSGQDGGQRVPQLEPRRRRDPGPANRPLNSPPPPLRSGSSGQLTRIGAAGPLGLRLYCSGSLAAQRWNGRLAWGSVALSEPIKFFFAAARQTVFHLARSSGLLGALSDSQRLTLFLAALCHDLEHPVRFRTLYFWASCRYI